jgi:hypothetical protein
VSDIVANVMAFSLHWVLLTIVLFGPLYWPAWMISKRAGLPGWLGLLIFVPILNVLAMWAFALLRWPVERRPAATA